jgi:hypothetical protein
MVLISYADSDENVERLVDGLQALAENPQTPDLPRSNPLANQTERDIGLTGVAVGRKRGNGD